MISRKFLFDVSDRKGRVKSGGSFSKKRKRKSSSNRLLRFSLNKKRYERHGPFKIISKD